MQVLRTLFVHASESNKYVANSELQFFMNKSVMNSILLCKIYFSVNFLKITVFARVISAPAYFAHPNF